MSRLTHLDVQAMERHGPPELIENAFQARKEFHFHLLLGDDASFRFLRLTLLGQNHKHWIGFPKVQSTTEEQSVNNTRTSFISNGLTIVNCVAHHVVSPDPKSEAPNVNKPKSEQFRFSFVSPYA